MQVEVDGTPYSVHFVVKSGREIRGKLTEEDVWYQITRPIDSESDAVILISAPELTLPLRNRFEAHNRKSDQLRYIAGSDLAALLKNYDLLS